ncbi:MYND-type domain-containing protein [Mycena kentingensis (nom. inval.)]|nr:MYND-type domain-containing protein [Mycena kentingensis (nom. inval.)]
MSATSSIDDLPGEIRAVAEEALVSAKEKPEIIDQLKRFLQTQPEQTPALASLIVLFLSFTVDKLLPIDPESDSASFTREAKVALSELAFGYFCVRSVDDTVFGFEFNTTWPPAHTPLGIELLERGLVQLTCKALSYIAKHVSREEQPAPQKRSVGVVVHTLLSVLTIALFTPPGSHRIPESISRGLLHSIIGLVGFEECDRLLDCTLRAILGQSLVRPRVLAAVKEVFPELCRLEADAGPAFRETSFFPLWEMFTEAMTHRVKVYERYMAGEFPVQKMCDNFKCSLIGKDTEFQRCSGCRLLTYCSLECQKEDWLRGGHKKGCALLRPIAQAEANLDLSPEDRDFLRVVMDFDLHHSRVELFNELVRAVGQPPYPEPVVYFNYFQPGNGEEITRMSGEPAPKGAISFCAGAAEGPLQSMIIHGAMGGFGEEGRVAWGEMVRRAKASGGRMVLDCAMFGGGSGFRPQIVLVPLRLREPLLPKIRGVARIQDALNNGGSGLRSLRFEAFHGPSSEFH